MATWPTYKGEYKTMVEVKFAPDKPMLLCIMMGAMCSLSYIENNSVHQFSKEEQKKLKKLMSSRTADFAHTDFTELVSDCLDKDFEETQFLEI